jgi:hypothetical protein
LGVKDVLCRAGTGLVNDGDALAQSMAPVASPGNLRGTKLHTIKSLDS